MRYPGYLAIRVHVKVVRYSGSASLPYVQKPSMSSICSTLPEKQNQNQLDGTIEFQNVHFSYPTRPNVKVRSIIYSW